jgi:trehalose/maltose hydrolase-like predicted phosphorylase
MSREGLPAGVGRTAEAIVFTAEAVAAHETWLARAVSDRVTALRAAGVEVVAISRSGARGQDDVMREILGDLALRGIGPGLVLLVGGRFGGPGEDAALLVPEAARMTVVSVGEEPCGVPAGVISLGGGTRALLALLDEQLRRRACLRVPGIDEDPAWTLVEAGDDPVRRRVTESLLTLGAAGLATRGSIEETVLGGQSLVLAAGIYTGTGPAQHLLPGPVWTGLGIEPTPDAGRRVLDLRTGVLARTELTASAAPVRTVRLVSIAAPGVVAMRAEAPASRLRRPGPPLRQAAGTDVAVGRRGHVHWAWADADAGGGIGAVAVQHGRLDGDTRVVQRIAAYSAGRRGSPDLRAATARLQAAEDAGFDRLLAAHRAAWAARWDAVDVEVPGDPEAQLALRFALFQLWCAIKSRGELAVGARGLSGTGYAGHVFWDADVFLLPAVVTMDPAAAAAMIRYRVHRLDAARERARAAGRRGARFPWESAAGGEDVTPADSRLGGQVIPILTGPLEEHITADVAWAAAHYARWTGRLPRHFAVLLAETARYWASRCWTDTAGRAHIGQVIGPDEYHERVDDNAFTNVMARWNLRAAASLAGAGVPPWEAGAWRELAARLTDGYDPATGLYEQFAGYLALEPLLIGDVAAPPVAADLLLGRDRVARSQLIKQPDVLMLHHLVPEETEPGSLEPNLDFYGPRTAHGSSLSPAITASLLARAGRADDALEMLRTALRLDLDDLTGTTGAGLHMATLAGAWQAVVAGFAGVRVTDGVLTVDPRLPSAWDGLRLRFLCLGRKVRLDITRDRTEISADRPLLAGLAGQAPQLVKEAACFRAAATKGGGHDRDSSR